MLMSKKTQKWAVPLIAVFLGMLLGAILMLCFGYNPLWAYNDLLYTAFGSVKNIGEIFRAMGPLILIALGFSVASKAGFFNVGLPGQALMGWVMSVWFALSFPDLPKPVSVICTVVVGLIAGGISGAIPGILRAFLGTSEVIVTIMMNYIILYGTQYLIQDVFPDKIMRTTEATIKVSENASYQTEWLSALTDNSRINIGIFIALFAVFIVWFLMRKTTLGYEITSVGINPHAAEYAGMSAKHLIVVSMIISGALAGLGGTVEGLGTFGNVYSQTSSLSIGWDGMAVSLLAVNTALGIPFASFLYAVLSIGKTGMIGIPSEIIDVVSAFIIFFVGADYLIRQFIKTKKEEGGK
ncbi:putative sugar ABC transporter, permease protein,putative [Streptococcus infantarius subsp. infantarius]|nr:putative sugar ABC transporter, permease protein,putative [Streptococcus infantarius subsp. infantarius]